MLISIKLSLIKKLKKRLLNVSKNAVLIKLFRKIKYDKQNFLK